MRLWRGNHFAQLEPIDQSWRGANIQVTYPGKHLGDLSGVLRPFVLLEVGSARVTPARLKVLAAAEGVKLSGAAPASAVS